MPSSFSHFSTLLNTIAIAAVMASCAAPVPHRENNAAATETAYSSGPSDQGPVFAQNLAGDPTLGRDVFRFETFGNEGFWTDAVRLPAGVKAARLTPMQALELGLQIDVDAVDAPTKAQLTEELRSDPTGRTSRLLNDPSVTQKLIMANAVIGMSARNGKVGTSCALCHTMSDASVFKSPHGGSIGRRIDGLANHELNVGKIFATAANTRALYPVAQLQLAANHGKTLGRAPRGLTETSTEAEFDAYFSNSQFYPVGMFDDTFDGNGNPMHNTPLFRQDLAAPYGSEGLITKLDDFSNLVYTTLFDQTMLTTPGGRAFVHKLAGAAGDEMINDYVSILRSTRVTGYPYVQRRTIGQPGELATPIGARVDDRKLLALNAYLASVAAPQGVDTDNAAAMRGRVVFMASGCTSCHNVDQRRAVPTEVHPMVQIWPGDNPAMLANRDPPLSPVLDTPGFFDDKMTVVNASIRGDKRGVALPLLLDLARKPTFLHDDTVTSLDALLSASRGATAPHPFFIKTPAQRADVEAYLKNADTRSR